MNKFKVFFTFLAIIWLCLCGVGSIYAFFESGSYAWLGVSVNAFALPLWLLFKQLRPAEIAVDSRESPAFAGVLLGLGLVLLLDTKKSLAVYLAIYNLFVFLLYLYHLSTIRHLSMPAVNSPFPTLVVDGNQSWCAEDACESSDGVLLLFLRGSFCAESHMQLRQLIAAQEKLDARGIRLVLVSMQAPARWLECLQHGLQADIPASWLFLQLDPQAAINKPFIAAGGAPFLHWLWSKNAVRPSAWLLDSEGYIVWRHLPDNYRVPGSGAQFLEQLYRLEE